MLPSHKSNNQLRPTARLSKRKSLTEAEFRSYVHYLSEPDLFFRILYYVEPEPFDWVVVGRLANGEPKIALWDGQEHFGVVQILDFVELAQSEQWHPRIY